MSDTLSSRLLHIRSLNHLAREHRFTYVGARILADSLAPEVIDDWTQEYILRKSQTNRRQVYWKYSLFKGFDRNDEPDYRKCVVGSPTTQLTEVWLLNKMSREAVFKRQPGVYSYHWPHEKSTHIFKYYFNGYMEREYLIAEAVADLRDARIVLLDLKSFYPSIDVQNVRNRFTQRIYSTSLDRSERETAIQCVEELTSIKNQMGLPIGPPLSHALANVFLEDIDNLLVKKYGPRYFRYVDDFAFVVPSNEVEDVKQFLGHLADKNGLRINPDKTDILTADEWSKRLEARERGDEDTVGHLIAELRCYLAHNQDDYDRVRDLFRDNGFSLPFARLRSVSRSSIFRRYLKSIWSQSGGLFGHAIPKPNALLARAEYLRRKFKVRLDQLSTMPLPSEGISRRWAIQDYRYTLNRLLYLQPAEDRRTILELIPDCLELRPSKAVVRALVTGDATELIQYPGPTVLAFCELWLESNTLKPRFTWSTSPAKEHRDSVSVLALHGLCSPPDGWTKQLSEQSSQLMVNLSSHLRPSRRSFDDFSYIDEMESLFLGPQISIERCLHSRFDDGEDISLPALSLGGDDYIS